MAYQPIENYGLIGNMHTAALVAMNGSIDWFCFPHFDSPSVFGAILDDKKGGRFKIYPTVDGVTYKQFYWPDTNVLVTRFLAAEGAGEITDFMPVGGDLGDDRHQMIRIVRAIRGTMEFRMECRPAFNYARDSHTVELRPDMGCFHAPGLSLGLKTRVPLEKDGDGLTALFTLAERQTAIFVLDQVEAGGDYGAPPSEGEANELFEGTVSCWHRWLSSSTYTGRWREAVHRSVLALKLLTYEPTGAIVAAPTCSLPEELGGERNWDYRYTWIRDAAFTLYALMRVGFNEEAARFMHWLEARCEEAKSEGTLQVMYGIDGRHDLSEESLTHLEGYRGSRPVRIGNGAFNQLQLDIYGELMDSVYLYNKHGSPISYDLWNQLRRMVDWVCDHWQDKDESVWEIRGGRQHFVYSKLMCWVALDRGLRLADKRSFPADRERWLRSRDQLYEGIITKGWSKKREAFVLHYGSESLDAANLMMPLVFFMSPTDPRMLKTLDAVNQSPERGGLVSSSLVYRYNVADVEDGLPGGEGTFNICTFWLIEALTRAGRMREARLMFEQMLGYANHLGLYSEQTSHSGEAIGNFPQAFTHLALISAAYNLDKALGRSRRLA